MRVYIRFTAGRFFPYSVWAGEDWPHGRLITTCMTLWGAKRVAAHTARQPPDQTVWDSSA